MQAGLGRQEYEGFAMAYFDDPEAYRAVMGNARPEVLAVAKRVIGSNADEGLAEFLEELVETHAVEPL